MNKYKKLVSNTVIFGIGSFGSKILTLLLTRLYTAKLNPADLSTKELLEMTANFVIPIVTFSIMDAIIRYGIDKNYDNHKVFTSACVTEIAGIVLLLLLSPLLTLLPYTDGYVILLVVYCITSGFRQIAQQFVRARGLVRLYALDGIGATLTLLIFNLVFIGAMDWGISGFMFSVILSDFCSGIFLWVTAGLRKYVGLRYVDKRVIKTMLRFSVPLIPSSLLWMVTGYSDRLFIRYLDGPSGLVGETAAGVFSVASKIPNLVSTISTIFFQAWNMSAIEEVDSKDRNKFYQKIFETYQSFMFIAAAWIIVFVQPLSAILIDSSNYPEYATAYTYTPVLVCSVLMMCMNQFMSSIYTATQHTTHSFWTALIAAAVNVVLNIFFVHEWGITGATYATFFSYFVGYIIRLYDARRYIYFPVNHAKFITNTAMLFLLGFIVIDEPPLWILWLAIGLIFMTFYNFDAVKDTIQHLLRKKYRNSEKA